jgi:catechol-2,3-dioxygenase
VRFTEVVLASPDPARAAAFYLDVLGLHVAGHDGVRVGESVLRFEAGEPTSPYPVAFTVPCNQIRDAKVWLERRAPLLRDEVFDFAFWSAEAVYCDDRDGNVVELIARRRLANPARTAFGPESLLGICEVGLPAADPPAVVGALEGTLGLAVYSGDRREFTAVGDEHALFIVVRRGRRWLPTEREALPNPARVRVESPVVASVEVDGPVRILGGHPV